MLMPWKDCSVMEERLRFVARLLEGETMTDLCREFGISRKTGYKLFNRYRDVGVEAFTDRSRRPVRYANQLPDAIERMIVRLKKEKPHWGARKIRELLVKRLDGDVCVPAKSTVHAVLDRHALVSIARKRRNRAEGTSRNKPALAATRSCVNSGRIRALTSRNDEAQSSSVVSMDAPAHP
jgi:transposase